MLGAEEIKVLIDSKKLLIFDFDGVIADSVDIKTEAFGELYSEFGEKIVKEVKLYHENNGGVSRYEKINYFNNILLKDTYIRDSEDQFANKFSKIIFKKIVACSQIEGSIEFLERCRQSKKVLAINSATPTNELIKIIRDKKLEKYFSYVLGSPQSKTVNLTEIIDKTSFDKDESIFFGDAYSDIEAAERIGVDFIGLGPFFQNYDSRFLRASILNFNDLII
jgi:phosphoglycolate phosphatase-like HAD superfamily hydrolase